MSSTSEGRFETGAGDAERERERERWKERLAVAYTPCRIVSRGHAEDGSRTHPCTRALLLIIDVQHVRSSTERRGHCSTLIWVFPAIQYLAISAPSSSQHTSRDAHSFPFPFGLRQPLSPTLPTGPTGHSSSSLSTSQSSLSSPPSLLSPESEGRERIRPRPVFNLGGLTVRTVLRGEDARMDELGEAEGSGRERWRLEPAVKGV
jgi:hypothetical protein